MRAFRLNRIAVAFWLLLVLPIHGSGAAAQARFTRIMTEQGLSQGTVQAIVQDHVGYLWFGTEEGLNRFDGYTFVVFKHNSRDPGSLPDDIVSALYEDRQQRLWVGTEHGLGLFDHRTETFTSIPAIADRVTSIIEGVDGTLWVAAQGGGLFLLKPGATAFVSYQPQPGNRDSLASFRLSSLLQDRKGRLWIGTRDAGLDLFEPIGEFGRFIHFRHNADDPTSLSHDDIWGLAEDPSGNIWVATYGGGVSVLDHRTGKFRHYRHRPDDPNSLPTDLLTTVFVDRLGTVRLGTDGKGMLEYRAEQDRFVTFTNEEGEPGSLSQNVVRSIYSDVQGQIWVGTFLGGVNVMKKSRPAFGYFNHAAMDPSSLSDSGVASFLEDTQGRIWVGTEAGWLNRYDRGSGTFTRYRFPSDRPEGSAILSLHQDRSGRIWAGSYLGGLGLFDPKLGTFRIFKHRPGDPSSLANDEVWALAEGTEGEIWVGTNAGLDRFDPDRTEVTTTYQFATPGGMSYTGVRSLLIDREGNLWVGTSGGLGLRRRGANDFVNFRHNSSDPRTLSNDFVSALHQDGAGRLWVGTLGGGLNLLDPATGVFTLCKDLPSNFVCSIEEDAAGQLWLSSNHGLIRLDPASLGVSNFDLTNGLRSLQFHLGAGLKTRAGKILFGSLEGFYELSPEAIEPETFAPPIVLTAFRIFNEPARLPTSLSSLTEITLSPDDKIISLEFAALDYSFPRRNSYAYQLQGFSDHWIELQGKREVTFTNLDPGTYVFIVKASNSDGVFQPASMVRLNVVVRPAFWDTWWFRATMVAIVALGLLAAHRIRVRRLTADLAERKRVELALRQAEEKYRRLFEEDLSADVIAKPDGSVLACNPSFANLFGFDSIDEALNCNLASLDLNPGEWTPFVERVRENKKLEYYETELRRRDGSRLSVISNIVGVFDDSQQLIEIRIYIFNNTEHKKLEMQLLQAQKMEAIGRLAGGVAHDFNNWLTPIIGYSQLLLDATDPSDPKRRQIGEISKAGERASELASKLLTFSRKQVLQPRVISLNHALADIQDMLKRLIGEDIELITRLDPSAGKVKADPGQIEQVILNLVLNSRDAMPKGGKLTIETSNAELDNSLIRHELGAHKGSCVMLAVSDTGCGMDAQTQAHIFEPFFTTKESGKGTGLGLSTVYGIIKQSGGHISVYSEVERGTTFKIYFPKIEEAHAATERGSAGVVPHGSETIVLVEDEPMVRDFVAAALRQHGYSVMVTVDALEALQIANEHQEEIHLLVTDVVMPKMSGPELAERFLIARPGTKILYMSGYAGDAIVHHGILESGLPFLQKPFTPDALARKVDEVLH
jgi:PAS domain S-box-containing protein